MRCNGTELVDARSQVWDDNTLSWVPERQAVVSTDTLNVTLPATAATAAKQDTGNTSLASIAASVGGTLAVSGPLTDSQLRATAVPVSATNLDIRDLSSATDSIAVTDGGGSLTVDGTVGVSGSVAVTNAALSVTGGGVEATALRVTVASDSTGVLSVDDNGGSLTVDGTVGVSGSVAVTNAALSVTGGGVEASALRVTIASDSTGVLSVDDNGSSLTVDGTVAVSGVGGTVAVTQSGTWDEVGINDSGNSITVDAPVGTPVFVRLSDGAAALTTTSGRLAVDPSGVTSPISAASLPLPTGAATAALQTQPGVDIAVLIDTRLLHRRDIGFLTAKDVKPAGCDLRLAFEPAGLPQTGTKLLLHLLKERFELVEVLALLAVGDLLGSAFVGGGTDMPQLGDVALLSVHPELRQKLIIVDVIGHADRSGRCID